MADKIRILSTSDVHGYIYPYSYANGNPANEGLAKIKSLIDSLKNENTLIIDNGDMIEGSPFTFYHYSKEIDKPCPLSLAMKEIGYDYVNLGNHDFNYGKKPLDLHLDSCGATLLTANIRYEGKQLGPDYVIHNFNGKKLAMFAIATHCIPNWEDPAHIEGYEFLNAFDTAKRIVEELKEKEKPDYIVCIYHGGFERDPETGEPCEEDTGENQGYRIAEEIRDIDVLISGHQHRTCAGKLFNTYYTHPFQHGAYLSFVEIDTDTDQITADIIEATSDADKTIMNLCREEENKVQLWLDTPLGKTDMELRIKDEYDVRFHKSQLATLINIIQRETCNADLSGAALFLNACGLDKDITMRSLVNTYIFPNTLFVKKINGKILKEYLEQSAEFWSVKDEEIIINPLYDFPTPAYHNYDMVDGVSYTIKASNPSGNKIIELTRNGVPVKDDDEFTLAVNSYRNAGSGGFSMIKNAPTVKEIQKSVLEIIAEYIMKNQFVHFEPVNNIKIIY